VKTNGQKVFRTIGLLLAVLGFHLILGTDTQAAPHLQGTPTPSYGIGQLLVTFSIDLPYCWDRDTGGDLNNWVPCGASPGTPGKTIDEVWPTTVEYFEFTLPSDGWVVLEVEATQDETYIGGLGYELQRLDESDGEWKGIRPPKVTSYKKDGNMSRPLSPKAFGMASKFVPTMMIINCVLVGTGGIPFPREPIGYLLMSRMLICPSTITCTIIR